MVAPRSFLDFQYFCPFKSMTAKMLCEETLNSTVTFMQLEAQQQNEVNMNNHRLAVSTVLIFNSAMFVLIYFLVYSSSIMVMPCIHK